MRDENARLGVETITRSDLTARSATKPRSSSSIGQWHAARTDPNWLEKGQQAGPRMGSSSNWLEKGQQAGPRMGSSSSSILVFLGAAHGTGCRLQRKTAPLAEGCGGCRDAMTKITDVHIDRLRPSQ